MKKSNFIKLFGIIVLAPVIGFSFASCATYPVVNYAYQHTGNTDNAVLAVIKDYQPVGIIFAKSSETFDSKGNHTGSKITFEMLMLEAQKLNADDVINVRIDVNQMDEVISANAFSVVTKTTYNYTASALAIKYTTAIQVGAGSDDPQNTEDILLTSVETTEKSVAETIDWRDRRLYLGGWAGYGNWYEGYYNGGIVGAKAEWLLTNHFSIDFDVGVEYGETGLGAVTPLLNVFAHVPFRFNSGFDIGLLGGIFAGDPYYFGGGIGVSLGYKLGRGIVFVDTVFLQSFVDDSVEFDSDSYGGYYEYYHDTDTRSANGVTVKVGYKIGLGNRKQAIKKI